jgi:predicted Zn-dependent protease
VFVLAIGILALLIWAVFLFFSYRRIRRSGTEGREGDLRFELEAAPWSDHHVESLLARNPDSPTLLGQYVANAIERQDLPEAQRRADIFVARAPRSPQAWLTRVDILRRAGREEAAAADLRKAMRRMPRDPDILLAAAREATRNQDWSEAARRFERMRQHFPERMEGYHEGLDALINDGRPDAAEAVIAESMRRLPEAWMVWHAAAWVAGRLGNRDEAVRRWEALRARFPAEPSGFLEGAEALAQAGRGEEAAALIRQARDFFPGNRPIADAAARLAPPGPPEPAPPEA